MSITSNHTSLKDIAKEAGVSVSLVSKVLNNRMGNTGVTKELAGKIHDTAKRMGYRKNLSAHSLRTGRHDAVGVMIHRHGAAGSGLNENVVRGIAQAASENGQKLILSFFERDEQFIELSENAHRGMMDGLIIGGALHLKLKEKILGIQQDGLPVVTIFDQPIHPDILNVGMDQALVTEIATRHLLDQGCQRIGTLNRHLLRHQGYLRVMEAGGLPVQIHDSSGFGYEDGVKAVKSWLTEENLPDGIVAESDAQAIGIINTLTAAGYEVPENIKVTGVDDSPFCEYMRPSLSSISQEHFKRGSMAMNMILKVTKGQKAEHAEVVPVLRTRESSAG